jgi:hypothetical protein
MKICLPLSPTPLPQGERGIGFVQYFCEFNDVKNYKNIFIELKSAPSPLMGEGWGEGVSNQ